MEYLVRLTQRFIGAKLVICWMAARPVNLFSILKSEGISTCRLLQRLALGLWESGQVAVTWKLLLHPIVVRPAISDMPSIISNCIREEAYDQLGVKRIPKLSIEAGIYIGDISAYFLSRFSGAKVIALEPNPESLVQSDINLCPYGDRANLVCAGEMQRSFLQRYPNQYFKDKS